MWESMAYCTGIYVEKRKWKLGFLNWNVEECVKVFLWLEIVYHCTSVYLGQ